MPSAPFLPSDIAGLLDRGGIVVTGNQRSARTLRLAFDRQCRANGLSTWQPPAIFSWDAWTTNFYRQLLLDGHTTRVLLNRTQELQVWRSIIGSDSQWTSLETIDSLAALAADAWQLLCAYRGQQRLKNLGVSGDTHNFQRWAQAFVRRCKSDEYLSAAETEETLVASSHLLTAPPELILVGFDILTPAQAAVIDALRANGVAVVDHPLPSAAAELRLVTPESPDDELSQAALWIRAFLIANPETKVAVIVPGLAAERREIERVFRHILAPELEDITANTASPYEFSLGESLASIPLVALALEILRFSTAALPIASVSRLLLSPYFATGRQESSNPTEFFARAEFDAFELRKTKFLRPEITLARLISLTATSKLAGNLEDLLSQLRSLYRTTQKLLADPAPKQRLCSDWADIVREILHSSGWPGAKALESVEFQSQQKFDSALDELATLDFEGIRVTFAKALAHLQAILERTLFAPESRDAPIQIMAPLEAAGSRFDAICFLRANDLDWPVRPTINPLLGWRLQNEFGMPGSDAALDFAYARRVTSRIASSAGTVLFSYARQTSEGHQRPSPMLAGLPLEPLAALNIPPASLPVELEVIGDGTLIPLTNFTVRGGAKILQLQAACGFRAFAEQRLWSTMIESPEPGMDALEGGSIVHSVLQNLWDEVKTQAALRALTPEQRAAQLSRSVEYSLSRAAEAIAADPAPSPWDTAYLDIQRQRLRRLLAPWLEIELNRAPFEVIQREQRETFTFGPLTMDLRIDRVDRLLDEKGGNILIDYKTGAAKPSDWAGERPDEPQLPLYAVLSEPESLAAVAFANIRAGKDMKLNGHAAREDVLPKLSRGAFDSLQDQLDDWHRLLTVIAEDYAAGDASVRPKAYPVTCKHCGQRLLCRLDPASLANDGTDDEEADSEAVREDFGEADA